MPNNVTFSPSICKARRTFEKCDEGTKSWLSGFLGMRVVTGHELLPAAVPVSRSFAASSVSQLQLPRPQKPYSNRQRRFVTPRVLRG
jgi:hypothetical protein